jgi:hypothetical protein
MITIVYGNDHAIFPREREMGDGSVEIDWFDHPGQHVTTINLSAEETAPAIAEALRVIPYHMHQGATPAWVQCTTPDVESELAKVYQITNERPADWGNANG